MSKKKTSLPRQEYWIAELVDDEWQICDGPYRKKACRDRLEDGYQGNNRAYTMVKLTYERAC